MSFLSFFRLFRCTTAVRPFTMHVTWPDKGVRALLVPQPWAVSKVYSVRLCNILIYKNGINTLTHEMAAFASPSVALWTSYNRVRKPPP